MNERRLRPLPPRPIFYRHIARNFTYGASLIGGSLLLGMAGYHWLAHFSWLDAMENSAMLLGGMGPVGEVTTVAGKLFATVYALYAGLAFIVTAGIVMAPVARRFLHRFHLELDASGS